MFGLFGRKIEDSDRAIKLFNSGKGGVWGYKGLWLLYDFAMSGYYLDHLGITLETETDFTPRSSEYSRGRHIEFKHGGHFYAVRITERTAEQYLLEDDIPFFHSTISIKVDGERKLNAKIQQYRNTDHWNIISISLLTTPLSWYHPLQTLFVRRNELFNKHMEELVRKYNDQDLWDE